MNVLNDKYSGGSLRLMLSRYIGLGTFDSEKMIKGKILNDIDYKNKNHYFEKLYENSYYYPPSTIGCDFNYNKFVKHGIELRIFDYFPEEYLENVINFILLLCQFSINTYIPNPTEDEDWKEFVINILKYGSEANLTTQLKDKINILFDTYDCHCFSFLKYKDNISILQFINKFAKKLYNCQRKLSVCQKMSPNMKEVILVDYNNIIKKEFKKTVNFQ